jgi:hypothetical protein
MVRTIAEIVMRTMTATENHNRAELTIHPLGEKIEKRFGISFRNIGTVQKSVEKLCGRLGGLGAYHIDS